MKSHYIQIRVTASEKEAIQRIATEEGFNTITALILWTLRNQYGLIQKPAQPKEAHL